MSKGQKTDKRRLADQTVDFEITSDVVQTHTSHTANKPQPKYLKK